MAQRLPEEKITLDQVLKLVDKLSNTERESLRVELNSKSRSKRWSALCAKVDKQNKGLPPLSDQEIVAEMKAIRQELRAKRGQSGS